MYTVDIMQHRTAFWLKSMFRCQAELVKCALSAMQQMSHGEVRAAMVTWLENDVMPSILTALMAWLDGDFMPQVHAEAKKIKVAPNKMPQDQAKRSSQEAPKPELKPSPPKCPPPPHLMKHAKASASSMPSSSMPSCVKSMPSCMKRPADCHAVEPPDAKKVRGSVGAADKPPSMPLKAKAKPLP